MKKILWIELCAVISVLSACATARFTPGTDSAPPMTPLRAQEIINSFKGACLNSGGFQNCVPVQNLHLDGKELVVIRRQDGSPRAFPLNKLNPYAARLAGHSVVYLTNYYFWAIGDGGFGDSMDYARHLAQAIYVLKNYYLADHTTEMEADLRQFENIAREYRAKNPKPVLPEDARRFQIQAEQALDRKQYAEAADLYRKALEIAPWWPEGHYNAATLFAQQGLLSEAIKDMKKYLALSPDSPDARKAQDKIYAWEGDLSSSSAAGKP